MNSRKNTYIQDEKELMSMIHLLGASLPRWQFYFRKGSASDAKSLIKASITVK
jgi:hypothetical protein